MRFTLNTAPDIRLALDQQGVITNIELANEIATENIRDWLGSRWFETVSRTERNKLERLLHKATNSQISHYQRVNQKLPSGLTIPIEYMAVRLGENTGFIAIGRDVRVVANLQSRLSSIQKSIERDHWKLKEIESHYQKLFESSSEAMMIVDCETFNISEANPAAIIALTLPGDESNWNLIQNVIDADQKLLNSTLSRACRTGTSPGVLIHFGEEETPWLIKASLIDFKKSEKILVQLQPIVEDFNNKHLIENFSLSDLINRLPDAFLIVNRNGKIIEANSTFYALANLNSDEELFDQNLSTFIEYKNNSIEELLETKKYLSNLSCYLRTSKNSMIEVSISTIHIKDIHHNCIAISIHPYKKTTFESNPSELKSLLDSKVGLIGKVSFRKLVSSSIELVEKHYIDSALALTNGNRTAAAKMLGLSRQSLYVKLARFNSKT